MMNMLLVAVAALAPWQTPEVNSINRLPARSAIVPAESEEKAVAIAGMTATAVDSQWVMDLNGPWRFSWKRSPEREWEKNGLIAVPGCWQVQGDFDPPIYVNTRYPLAFDGSGDPMREPDKTYTSFEYRNPVGRYVRTFKRPWSWYFRRTVIRFNGVSSAFELKINGKFAGYSEDSRLPAEFDITPYLKWWGENEIEVTVYKHSDGTYLECQDFWRLSGIFRDVSLVCEHRKAPHDLIVEAWLSDDYKQGRFTIRDEKGNVIKQRDVPQPKLWSPESPFLYLTPIELTYGRWFWRKTEHYAVTIGFRRVEIRDAVLYLNGKRVLFKGVNRHEMHPATGYTLTLADMVRDIRLMKSLNVNAVRTCHYPDDPQWYALCDLEGVMVVAEANIESHGAGFGARSLAHDPRWRQSHVERGTRMVQAHRNHPSILIWSLGNEAGMGENFVAECAAMRKLDPSRPIHYERAIWSTNAVWRACSDIQCPMYATPAACEKYVANAPDKPFVLCEYTHAMGNSNGGVADYWALARKYPSFQGGFVWDFVDQAVWKRGEKGAALAYGGDFGDAPNDGNFNCNGMVDALRNPHPGAYEIKHAYQSLNVVSFDFAARKAVVRNDHMFAPQKMPTCRWQAIDAAGKPTAKGTLDIASLASGQVREFTLAGDLGEAVTFRFTNEYGEDVAWDSFVRPFVPNTPAVTGGAVANPGFKYNFWRAPTDNDRGWGMPKTCAIWKKATKSQQLPAGVTSELRFTSPAKGQTLVDWKLTVPSGLPPIPRVGLTFTLPVCEPDVTWLGLGPWENYSDRAAGAIFGLHKAHVCLASGLYDERLGTIAYRGDRLNPDNYIEPGEQGYRTGCRVLEIGGKRIRALNAPFGFNAWPYPQTELEGKKHVWEMTASNETTVNIDAAQMGVGGDDSWSQNARPRGTSLLGAGVYHLQFVIEDITEESN